MLNHDLLKLIKHWQYISTHIHLPKNQKECDQLVNKLDQLLDIVKEDESHELIGLIDLISDLIEEYEAKKIKSKMGTGLDALKYLMEAHQISQSELPEIGSQGVISEILNGKRKLNLRQIKSLAKKFSVDPSTFIDDE